MVIRHTVDQIRGICLIGDRIGTISPPHGEQSHIFRPHGEGIGPTPGVNGGCRIDVGGPAQELIAGALGNDIKFNIDLVPRNITGIIYRRAGTAITVVGDGEGLQILEHRVEVDGGAVGGSDAIGEGLLILIDYIAAVGVRGPARQIAVFVPLLLVGCGKSAVGIRQHIAGRQGKIFLIGHIFQRKEVDLGLAMKEVNAVRDWLPLGINRYLILLHRPVRNLRLQSFIIILAACAVGVFVVTLEGITVPSGNGQVSSQSLAVGDIYKVDVAAVAAAVGIQVHLCHPRVPLGVEVNYIVLCAGQILDSRTVLVEDISIGCRRPAHNGHSGLGKGVVPYLQSPFRIIGKGLGDRCCAGGVIIVFMKFYRVGDGAPLGGEDHIGGTDGDGPSHIMTAVIHPTVEGIAGLGGSGGCL